MHLISPLVPGQRLLLKGHVTPSSDRSFHVLCVPDGKFLLNSRAAAILKLCDGSRTRAMVIDRVTKWNRNADGKNNVEKFLNAAIRQGWIKCTNGKNSYSTYLEEMESSAVDI